MTTSSLTCTQDGEWTVIRARARPLPARITVASFGLGACAAGLVTMWMGGNFGFWFFAWPLATLPALLLLTAFHDRRRRVQRKPVAVKRGVIRLPSGQEIHADQMYELHRRNTQSGRSVIIAGSSTTAAVGLMALETHNQLARVSYTVELAHDGTSSVLAGGLTEDQANALAAEVGRRSGCFAW